MKNIEIKKNIKVNESGNTDNPISSFIKRWAFTFETTLVLLLTFYFTTKYMFYQTTIVDITNQSLDTIIRNFKVVLLSFTLFFIAGALWFDYQKKDTKECDKKQMFAKWMHLFAAFTVIITAMSFVSMIAFKPNAYDAAYNMSMTWYYVISIPFILSFLFKGHERVNATRAFTLITIGTIVFAQVLLIQFGAFAGQVITVDSVALFYNNTTTGNPGMEYLVVGNSVYNVTLSLYSPNQWWAYLVFAIHITVISFAMLLLAMMIMNPSNSKRIKSGLSWGLMVFAIGWAFYLLDAWVLAKLFEETNVISQDQIFDPAQLPQVPDTLSLVNLSVVTTSFGNQPYAMTYLLIGLIVLGAISIKKSKEFFKAM